MQGRGRFFIILGAVLLVMAIVGGLLIWVLQGRGGVATPTRTPAPGETPVAPETRDVVVAFQNVGEGKKILPDAVGLRPVMVEELPEQPMLDPNDVVGKLARQDIYQGDVLVAEMVIAVEDVQRLGGRAASLIPPGRVAVAFPVSQLSAVNYAIQAGDRVDILISGAFIDVDADTQIKTPLIHTGGEDCQPGCQIVGDQVQRTFSQLTIDDAEVLAIGTWGLPSQPEEGAEGEEEVAAGGEGQLPSAFDSISLIVDPQDAVVLKYLRENGYVIDLALRSLEDVDPHEGQTEAVTLEYIMTRFRISSPTKLPYRLEEMNLQSITPAEPSPPPAQ